MSPGRHAALRQLQAAGKVPKVALVAAARKRFVIADAILEPAPGCLPGPPDDLATNTVAHSEAASATNLRSAKQYMV